MLVVSITSIEMKGARDEDAGDRRDVVFYHHLFINPEVG